MVRVKLDLDLLNKVLCSSFVDEKKKWLKKMRLH